MIYQLENSTRSLGLVPSTNRIAQPLGKYAHMVNLPAVKNRQTIKLRNASVYDTLKFMAKIAQKHSHEVREIAQDLKSPDLEQTLRNNWNWVFKHIAYELDQRGTEQIRTPLRLIKDQLGDCDCYSTFLAALLIEQGIPNFAFRMTKYERDWQHVYVIVPKDQNTPRYTHRKDYWVLDAVLDRFNGEKPYNKKHDYIMNLAVLDGFGNTSTMQWGNEFSGLGNLPVQDYRVMQALRKHLENTYAIIGNTNPVLSSQIRMALDHWTNPTVRDRALTAISGVNSVGLAGTLGRFKLKNIVKKTKEAVQKVGDKVINNRVTNTINKGVNRALDSKVGRAITRVFPGTIAARAGVIKAMKENLALSKNRLGIAVKLGYGLLTNEQAQKIGLAPADHAKAKDALKRSTEIFKDMGGMPQNFIDAVKEGFKKGAKKRNLQTGLNGGLGIDPATAAVITASGGAIAAMASLVDKINEPKVSQINANALSDQLALQKQLQEQSQGYNTTSTNFDRSVFANQAPKKDNTALYIGLGVGGATLIGAGLYLMSQKSKAKPSVAGLSGAKKATPTKRKTTRTKKTTQTRKSTPYIKKKVIHIN